jgi:ketosteroid isomerase-like protein
MPAPVPHEAYVATVHAYFDALRNGDPDRIVALFSTDGQVISPFLGRMPASAFFAKLADTSTRSEIDVFDVLVSAKGSPRALGYFNYRWTLRDGTVLRFDCCDVFDFGQPVESARGVEAVPIELMTIVYDTAPLRDQVGDKYARTDAAS